MIHISGRTYELIHEHKDGWNPEAFRERYSDVLERYDYVIGDWGYNQLRLKGFFRDNHPKATRDSAFSGMLDYINEYCNFGCAYFVLQRQPGVKRLGEDGEDIDSDDIDTSELFEGIDDAYDMPSRTGEASSAEEPEQEARTAPRIVREHQKREYHHRHVRKDTPKDADKEQVKDTRKQSNKERDRDKESVRQHQQTAAHNQQDRSQNGHDRDRSNRQRKPHFTAPKAPVAAAAETSAKPKQTQQPVNRK